MNLVDEHTSNCAVGEDSLSDLLHILSEGGPLVPSLLASVVCLFKTAMHR